MTLPRSRHRPHGWYQAHGSDFSPITRSTTTQTASLIKHNPLKFSSHPAHHSFHHRKEWWMAPAWCLNQGCTRKQTSQVSSEPGRTQPPSWPSHFLWNCSMSFSDYLSQSWNALTAAVVLAKALLWTSCSTSESQACGLMYAACSGTEFGLKWNQFLPKPDVKSQPVSSCQETSFLLHTGTFGQPQMRAWPPDSSSTRILKWLPSWLYVMR